MLIFGLPMTLTYNSLVRTMIRLSQSLSLIFFVLIFLITCKQKGKEDVTLVWNDKQATGILIPKSLLKDQHEDSILKYLQVRLENNSAVMLGEYNTSEDKIVFKPLIPFTRGLSYEVFIRNGLIGKLQIPSADPALAAKLFAVFPTADTLPENLLKIYLRFSAPMREGEAFKHIALSNHNNDTLPDVFLNLQPELWNTERTVLTVWLDPGRIKRDLIPNQKMGNPLNKGQQYTLSISNSWKDVQGLPLQQSYTKKFIVGARDSTSPNPELWILHLPAEGTDQPLKVSFKEPLDYFLISETISIVDEKGTSIPGKIKVINKETGFDFFPHKQWQPGQYCLRVASHLEDLAGNNLNKLFDRDIQLKQSKTDKKSVEKEFIIEGGQ